MRTLTVLYAIVLKYYIKKNRNCGKYHSELSGICMTFYNCNDQKLITNKELGKLKAHFESQRTKRQIWVANNCYWFQQYLMEPRIELLESLIIKTNRK